MTTARILVVDDTPTNLRLMTAVLEPLGYAVATATDGPRALELARAGDVDLVLLDITMPGMNGHEVCRRLREDPSTRRIPVVMITATGEEEKVRALEAGADDFIRRPFELPELHARVRSLLRVKSAIDIIEGQAAELEAWNRTLTDQVAEQVAELDRLRSLERFLPNTLGQALIAEGGMDRLDPHRAEVAVAWIRVEGFDRVAMRESPETTAALLEDFHGVLGPLAERARCTVGASTGDALMLVFGDPLALENPSATAVGVALDVQEAMEEAFDTPPVRGHRLSIGAGVSSGHATVGVSGVDERRDYTAIGPVEVIARRLCLLPNGGVRCDSRVRLDVLAVDVERLGPVDVAGGGPPVEAVMVRRAPTPASIGRAGLTINILGPVEVLVDGVEVPLPSARSRTLLAALAARAGEVTSVDALADELWEGSPPASGPSSIRVYVSRLRKALADAGFPDVLETRPPGYRLVVDDTVLDSEQFASAIAEGERCREGNPARAIERYRMALSLWRGRALPEVADSPFGVAVTARLLEARLGAAECCLELEIAAGHLQAAVTDLEALIADHPLRGRLWALRMVGLAGLDRHPEAIKAFDDYAVLLETEIGVEPSPSLVELRERVADAAPIENLLELISLEAL